MQTEFSIPPRPEKENGTTLKIVLLKKFFTPVLNIRVPHLKKKFKVEKKILLDQLASTTQDKTNLKFKKTLQKRLTQIVINLQREADFLTQRGAIVFEKLGLSPNRNGGEGSTYKSLQEISFYA